jgi:hypothetical protein
LELNHRSDSWSFLENSPPNHGNPIVCSRLIAQSREGGKDTTHPITSQSSPQSQLGVARSSWLPGRLTQVTKIQETLIIITTPFSQPCIRIACPPLSRTPSPSLGAESPTSVTSYLPRSATGPSTDTTSQFMHLQPSSSPTILPPHPSSKS